MKRSTIRWVVWGAAGLAVGAVAYSHFASSRAPLAVEYDALPSLTTPAQFQQEVVASDQPVLVDFYATWCGPCKQLAPTIAQVAREFAGRAKVFRVDIDKATELADRLRVDRIPTVLVYSGGRETARMVGLRDIAEYRAKISLPPSPNPGKPAPASVQYQHDNQGEPNTMSTSTAARTVTMHGNPLELTGNDILVGAKAPDFVVVDNGLKEVHLNDLAAKVIVISAVPSLDTPVCDTETRRFNVEASKLGPDVQVLTISMDLPFAQARWCAAAGVKNVQTLSDYRYADFGSKYGTLIKGLRLECRAIFVLGPDRKVAYIQRVSEITQEPNYDEVLAAVRKLLG